MGLPGFSGFVAELQVLLGAWRAFPTLALVTGVGIVLGVAYALRALHYAFFPDKSAIDSTQPHSAEPMDPISVPERFGAILLIGASLLIGLFPGLLLNWIGPAFEGPLFEALRKGGSW